MKYEVPQALWINQEVEVSLDFNIMNIGLWDVNPCEFGCALLDVMLYLSEDSEWEPAHDTRVSLPGYISDGKDFLLLID